MARKNMALDLVLRTLLYSSEFAEAEDKNWSAVARLVPGTTSQECSKRWMELLSHPPMAAQIRTGNGKAVGSANLSKLLQSVLNQNQSLRNDGQGGTGSELNGFPNSELSGANRLGHGGGSGLGRSDIKGRDLNDLKQESTGSNHQVTKSVKSQSSVSENLQGPNMVIHVCDESKNLKQDFTCPRELLVREMHYFAEYLSVEAQRWEEVDISVHCDVQIFDWLMKYVKRKLVDKNKSEEKKPKLEPNNVISILISSDFLKMDSLVTECIQYCHENMSAIVATPCNMNCINDKLVTRIARLFSHNELEDIKDRKDKFKSKLFCKKIEELFDPNVRSICSPGCASTLYRCAACNKLLTAETQGKLGCVVSRMTVDQRGHISFIHIRDPTWDVNDYLQNLRETKKSWREVYWSVWGSVNTLHCYRCHEYFPVSEMGHCRYHSMPAKFEPSGRSEGIVMVYPCCQQQVLRFDTTGQVTGCSVRDHKVSIEVCLPSKTATPSSSETADKPEDTDTQDDREDRKADEDDSDALKVGAVGRQSSRAATLPQIINNPVIVEDLLAHKNVVCVPFQKQSSTRSAELNVFGVEELAAVSRTKESDGANALSETVDPSVRKSEHPAILATRRTKSRVIHRASMRRMRLAQKADGDFDLGEDEDQPESEDTEPEVRGPSREKPRPPRKVTSASRRDFSTFKSYKWDPQRSSRWNQDAQREEDLKRMTDLVTFLTKQRTPVPQEKVEKNEKQKPKEFSGGIFSKLEYQFRGAHQPVNSKTHPGGTQMGAGPRTRKLNTMKP